MKSTSELRFAAFRATEPKRYSSSTPNLRAIFSHRFLTAIGVSSDALAVSSDVLAVSSDALAASELEDAMLFVILLPPRIAYVRSALRMFCILRMFCELLS